MQWKRKISAMLAGAMLLGSLPAAVAWDAPDVQQWETASRDGVKARFFVGSDTHIGRSGATAKLTNALNVFYQIDPDADGVLLVGDLTDGGTDAQYTSLLDVINGSSIADRVFLSMGNHDHYSGGTARFEKRMGQRASDTLTFGDAASPVTVVKLNASGSGGDYTGDYTLLKDALAQANEKDPTAPVLVLGHHGIKNTAYVTNEWYGSYGEGSSRDMSALLAQYPQAIHFSGHSHSTLEDARSIYQDDGFTAIQDSTIGAYFENETGKVDPSSGQSSTRPENSETSSQALRVDILEDNSVQIYRMDLTLGEYIFEDEPWAFSSTDLPYTEARSSTGAPTFAPGSQVTVANVTGDGCTVRFPAASPASGANVDMVHEYEITLTPTSGDAIVRRVFADYYTAPQKKDWSVKIIGLSGGTTYTASVRAQTSFGAQSEPLTASKDVTTGAGAAPVYPAEAILDVDFSSRPDGADAKGHTLKTYGAPVFSVDETTGRAIASFDGKSDGLRYAMTSDDYQQLTKNFTVELYYKPKDTANNNPLGNTQNSGFCFEQKSGTNTLQFWAHLGGSYVKPEVNVTKDAWNHVVATYDGANLKLYLNGELKSTKAASGAMTEPPHYLFLGGDTTSTGALEYKAFCDIALARVYTGTMTAQDVKTAYASATTPDSGEEDGDTSTADMLDVSFAGGTAADQSQTANTAKTIGSPVIQSSAEMGKRIAAFNGEYDAFLYPFDDAKYAKMSAGATIESVFCYDEVPAFGESDMFSNQQGGGLGLGLENGRLQFFCNLNKTTGGNGYVQPNAAIEAGKWYHAVGVFDGTKVKLYLNGELVSEKDATGATIHWPTGAGAKNFVIGGDSNASGGVESYAKGSVSLARLYSKGMTDAEVKTLYQQLTPPVLTVSGSMGRMERGSAAELPIVSASGGQPVDLTDITGPSGLSVLQSEYDAASGKLTPTQLGTYTFVYTLSRTGQPSQVKEIQRECVADASAKINLGLVSTDTMAAGIQYNVAPHASLSEDAAADAIAFDLRYDADLLEYIGFENAAANAVTKTADGTLHITKTGLTRESFANYASTRLAKLTFRVKEDAPAGETTLSIENVTTHGGGEAKPAISNQTIQILSKSGLDKNRDGVIGAGDVALAASASEAEAIAAAAAIYPYKHAVVITMDGGGICFRPDQMYYASGGKTTLTGDPAILSKRANAYALSLFNEYCASSYSAKSETPTISAQNYTSILHGKEYATAQSEYKIDNNRTGTYYYPDFGKETPVYPSVFRALGETFPRRGNAAFAEWVPIINGIIEPDAPVYTHTSTKSTGSLADVASYIRSDAFRSTAMVYMQSDYMDSVGHSSGYYTDAYYTALQKYDAYLKEVMDALTETGSLDDTLVLFTADHGGTSSGGHGGTTDQEYDVQIAMGGQTISSGKQLTGGTNHDIPAIVLAALRGAKPDSMDGTAQLFEQAALSQTALASKNRDIEQVTFHAVTGTKTAVISLKNAKSQIRAADMVIDTAGKTVSSIQTEGTVARRELREGKLYLTIVYASQPETLATLTFAETADESIKMQEIMLGTKTGDEIYCDLANSSEAGELPASGIEASVLGQTRAALGEALPFQFALAKMERVAAAELTFEVSDKTLVKDGRLIGLNGFKLLSDVRWSEEGDKLIGKVTLSYLSGGSLTQDELTQIAEVTFASVQNGAVGVKLTNILVGGYDENGKDVFLTTAITTSEAVTVVGSKFDVNLDGKIDLLDIVHAQQYYQRNTASSDWASVKHCDVNGDGVIDLEDLIAILHAYSA